MHVSRGKVWEMLLHGAERPRRLVRVEGITVSDCLADRRLIQTPQLQRMVHAAGHYAVAA